jgi:hypothetical protein
MSNKNEIEYKLYLDKNAKAFQSAMDELDLFRKVRLKSEYFHKKSENKKALRIAMNEAHNSGRLNTQSR